MFFTSVYEKPFLTLRPWWNLLYFLQLCIHFPFSLRGRDGSGISFWLLIGDVERTGIYLFLYVCKQSSYLCLLNGPLFPCSLLMGFLSLLELFWVCHTGVARVHGSAPAPAPQFNGWCVLPPAGALLPLPPISCFYLLLWIGRFLGKSWLFSSLCEF